MITYTLVTPFVDKPLVIPVYLRALDRIEMPREKCKIVWLDRSNNPVIHKMLQDYRDKHASEYAEFVYILDDTAVSVPNVYVLDGATEEVQSQSEKTKENLLVKRQAVADSMNILLSHRVGDLLIWEDDIIPPADAWLKIKSIFGTADYYYAVSACQYCREKGLNFTLVWDFIYKKTSKVVSSLLKWGIKSKAPRKFGMKELSEKKTGISIVGATATGFILFRESFINGYKFYIEGIEGQDVIICRDIYETAEGKVCIHWGVKCLHLDDSRGTLQVFRGRTALCLTEMP